MKRIVSGVAMMLVLVACSNGPGDVEQAESAVTADSNSTTSMTEPSDTTTTTTAAAMTTTTAPAEEAEEDLGLDPDLRTIEVTMTEMAFHPPEFAVSTGETVQFVLRNDGAVEHEFRLTTQHAAEEHIASGHEGHDDDEGGHGHDEVSVVVDPDEVTVLTVTFEEAGEFDIVACLLPGHFEAGMHAPLSYES